MASSVAALAFVLILASSALAVCPERSAKADFDASEFAGTWHMQKVVQTPGYANTKCNHLTAIQGENGEMTLNIMYYNLTSAQDTNVAATLRKVDAASTEGKYTYFREGIFSHETTNFKILSTDSTNYAVIAFCDSKRDIHTVFLLTRKRNPTEEELKDGNSALPTDVTYVEQEQSDCPDHSHHA